MRKQVINILPFKRDYLPYVITVSLTNDCNLACPYCYVEKAKKYLDIETGKQIVDFAHKNLMVVRDKYKNILPYIVTYNNDHDLISTLNFFGGEPLLNFKVLCQIVEYAETTYPNDFFFTITTNGILLNDEICSFLKQHKIHVTISCDGIKQDQDSQRPLRYSNKSSYDILEKNIQLIQSYDINDIIIRMTVTKNNVNHFYDNYLLFEKMKFKIFAFDFEYFTDWTQDLLQIFYKGLEKVFRYRFTQYRQNINPPLKFLMLDELLARYIEGRLQILCNLPLEENKPTIFNNCGYGLEMLCIGTNGSFYPCHEEPDFYDSNFSNYIGSLSTGVDYEKLEILRQNIKKFEEDFLNNRQCLQDCILKENHIPCYYTSCPANLNQTKKVTTYNCTIRKYFLELILYYSNLLLSMDNELFIDKLKSFPSYQVYQDIISYPPGPERNKFINFYKSQIGTIKI